ncbi:hypothetical protein [Lentibacillus sediminis]|uniref:hypothetical protein n=1 Tax=Lentibacillus sediminis TaxID=1940529 RepID=UPI000C1C3A8B|nr:hypothetical protein [Lentibacillus sediminis]
MKKLMVLGVILASLLLSGCMSQASARVVEDIYSAALTGDEEYIEYVFAENYPDIEQNMNDLIDTLVSHTQESQGLANMGLRELRHGQLNEEKIAELNQKYDENWILVVGRVGDNQVALWTMQTDGYYYVADFQVLSSTDYNQEFLGS